MIALALLLSAAVSAIAVLHAAGIAAVFLGRGLAGYTSARRRRFPEQPFATYDRLAYSPLCLMLGAGYLTILVAGISP
jgi:hypothetical protein